MNNFAFFFGLSLVIVASAYEHGTSYVSRDDANVAGYGHEEHDEYGHGHEDHKEAYHHPAYKYEYQVHDPKTKDRHSQWEHRDGDVVKGEYTLDEADGTIRKVSYTSSKHEGFNAKVEKIGHASHPEHYEHHVADVHEHEQEHHQVADEHEHYY